ncbi:MAG: hypothetical protein WCG42_09670, partial [Parachlamydiaceae bacterium]
MVAKWQSFQDRLHDLNAKLQGQEGTITETNGQIEGLQTQLADAKELLSNMEKELRKRGEDVFSVRSTKEIKTKERQNNQERVKEIDAKEKQWQAEIEEIVEKRKLRAEERKNLQRGSQEVEKRFQSQEQIVIAQRDKVKSLEEKLSQLRAQQQSRQSGLFKLVQTENESESQIKQMTVRLENAQEKQVRIEERKKVLSQMSHELINLVEEKKKTSEEAIQSLEKKKEFFAGMEHGLQEIAVESNRNQETIDQFHHEIGEARARLKSLQRLREDMEGFSSGSKKLLQEAAKAGSLLFGKLKGLYEYIQPEKGAEAAVAAVLKAYGQTLVVETESDFLSVVDYASKNKIKDVSLICIESIKQSKGSAKAIHAAENVLSRHFLEGIHIAKKTVSPMEAIKDHAGVDVWIGDGILVDRHSVVFYSSQGENNVFLREAEIKTLEKKVKENELEKQQLEIVQKAIQQKRQQMMNDRSELDKVIRQAEVKLVELNFAMQRSAGDLEKVRVEEKQLSSEFEAVSNAMKALKDSIAIISQNYAKAKKEASTAKQEMEQHLAELEALNGTFKAEANDLRGQEAILQSLIDDKRKHAHGLHVLEVQDLESGKQIARLEQEIEMGCVLKQQIETKKSEVDSLLTETESALANAVAACNELEQQQAVRKKAVEHLESKINEKQRLLKKSETDRNQITIQAAQVESNRQSIEHDLQERHQLS